MALPELNDLGFIPVGTHSIDLIEISNKFCEGDINRTNIWNHFMEFFNQLSKYECVSSVYFFGSFVSDNRNPLDIDIAIEFNEISTSHNFDIELLNKENLTRQKVDLVIKEPVPDYIRGIIPSHIKFASKNLSLFRRLKIKDSPTVYRVRKVMPNNNEEYRGVLKFEISQSNT